MTEQGPGRGRASGREAGGGDATTRSSDPVEAAPGLPEPMARVLADYERQKGTILEYRNVAIEEGPLPDGAQPKASEHIRRSLFPCPDWAQVHVTGDHVTGPAGGRPGQVPQPAEPAPLPRLLQEQKGMPDKLESTPTGRDPKP